MNKTKQERLSEEQVNYLQLLEASPGWKAEVIQLVREDFYYGLSKEHVQRYASKNGDIRRMKLYSQCLRNGYDDEVLRVLMDEEQDIYRCQLAVKFYERGIPLDTVKTAFHETRNAKELQLLFQELEKQTQQLAGMQEETTPYVQQLVTQIQDVLEQIKQQNEFGGEIQRVISVLEASQKEEGVREHLMQEIKDREMQISVKQDELNRGHKKVAQQREEIEKLLKEKENMNETIADLKMKLQEKEDKMSELNKLMADGKGTTVPILYSVPVADKGKAVGRVQVEYTRKKSNIHQGIISKLCDFFIPGPDFIKKVIEAQLDEQQLALVRTAMEKGLTDIQMNQIINAALSPHKMKEIIDLAVLINQNK